MTISEGSHIKKTEKPENHEKKQGALFEETCPVGQSLTLTPDEASKSFDISISLISVILIMLVGYITYMFFQGKNIQKNSMYARMSKFFEDSYGRLTITVIVTFIAMGLVTSLQTNIMQPLVEASILTLDLQTGIPLRKYDTQTANGIDQVTVEMFPGLFVQYLFSFFISLFIIFVLSEIVYQMSQITFIKNNGVFIIKLFGVILLVSLLIWNVYERVTIKNVYSCKGTNVGTQIAV